MLLRAEITDIILLYTFWVMFLMPVVAARFWQWWKNPVGIGFFSMDILLAAALLPSALRRMFGIPVTSPAFQWFVIAVFSLIAPVGVWRLWQLYKIQRKDDPS